MPGPTILRPPMSISPMDTLTPTQLHALYSVLVGDIILVEPESSLSTPYLLLVDTITSTSRNSIRIASKARYDITPANLLDLLRYRAWNFQTISCDWPEGNPLETSLGLRDTLTLNPTVEMLRMKFLNGKCLYQNCTEGLVRKSVMTVNDVHFLETEARSGRMVWTLCPYCMGEELQMRHEVLVTCSIPGRYGESVMRAHLQTINLKRLENDYSPLPWDVDLVVLDGEQTQQPVAVAGVQQGLLEQPVAGSQSRHPSLSSPRAAATRTITRRRPLPSPIQTRHSSRGTLHWPDGPRLSSHSFKWFQNAGERVLNDICGLCQEEYQDGERIVDLLCQHFYHERCLKMCFEVQREQRKHEACPLCRRGLVS